MNRPASYLQLLLATLMLIPSALLFYLVWAPLSALVFLGPHASWVRAVWRTVLLPVWGRDLRHRRMVDLDFQALSVVIASSPLKRRLASLPLLVLWPVLQTVRAIKLAATHGTVVAETYGVPRALQVVEHVGMTMRRPLLFFLDEWNDAYYRRRLYLPERGKKLSSNVSHMAYMAPFHNRHTRRARAEAQTDSKDGMRKIFAENGLPHIPLVARLGGGVSELAESLREGEGPAVDLFSKPDQGSSGIGARVWKLVSPNRFQDMDGALLEWRELVDRLRAEARTQVLQPRMASHPELAAIVPDVLMCVRIHTFLDRRDGQQFFLPCSFLKVPRQGSIVDNVHASGLVFPIVDVQAGTLGVGIGPRYEELRSHPETGAQITGVNVPGWTKIIDLALRSQKAFAPYAAFIGWDIAATAEGPIVVEGNTFPGFNEWAFDLEMHGELELLDRILHR